jgi:hypothetical protein
MMRSPEKPADFVESLSNDRPDFADEFRKRALEAKTRAASEEPGTCACDTRDKAVMEVVVGNGQISPLAPRKEMDFHHDQDAGSGLSAGASREARGLLCQHTHD